MSSENFDLSNNPFYQDSIRRGRFSVGGVGSPESAPTLSDEDLRRLEQQIHQEPSVTPRPRVQVPVEELMLLIGEPAAQPRAPMPVGRSTSPRRPTSSRPRSATAPEKPTFPVYEPVKTVAEIPAVSKNALPGALRRGAGRTAEFMWSGGKKRKLGSALLAATLAYGTVSEVTHATFADAVAFTKASVGIGSAEDNVFNAPDCVNMKPQFAFEGVKSAGNLLLRQVVFATTDERSKMKADKNYTPKTVDSFFESNLSVQMRSLSTKPFTNDPPYVLRVPQTIYNGKIDFGICFTDTVDKVIPQHGDKYNVDVDLGKIKVVPIFDDPQAELSYERRVIDAKKGQENNSPFPDGELARQAAVVVPNKKNTSIMNSSILSDILQNSLTIFNAGEACDTKLTEETEQSLQKLIDTEAGHHVNIDWHNGVQSPAATFAASTQGKLAAKGSKDFKIVNVVNSTPSCQTSQGGAQ